MKKIAYVLLVIAMFLCLTACSQDQYAKLGELMGKMSGNVYGIKPNMKDVDAATDKVDGTVKVDGKTGTVTVEIKSEDAKSIVDSVVAVKGSGSVTKSDALQKSLEEPILGKDATAEQKEAVKTQLTTQATESKIDTTGLPAGHKVLAEAVNDALDLVSSSLSDNPTKAELATFATIKTIADAVKSGNPESYIDTGIKALDALTVTSEVAGIDLFAEINITDLVNNFMDRSVSRDGDEDIDFSKWLPVVSKSFAGIINCMTDSNHKFSAQRYSKFIMECRAIKAAFEMMARAYADESNIDAILKKNIDLGLTIESLGRYGMAVVFIGMNDLSTPEPGEDIEIVPFIAKYIDKNYDALTHIEEKYKDLPDPTLKDSEYYDEYKTAVVAIANSVGLVTTEARDINEIIRDVREALDSDGSLSASAFNILSVTGMILVDSEYTSLLSLGDMDGTLSSLLKLITGKEAN